jgi:hypothetical protein
MSFINSLLMSPLLGHRPSLWITHIRRTGYNPPRGPNAGWWVLTTANNLPSEARMHVLNTTINLRHILNELRKHSNLTYISDRSFQRVNPLTAATSLYVKRFCLINTTINIKDILWRRLGNYKIWRIYTSTALKVKLTSMGWWQTLILNPN